MFDFGNHLRMLREKHGISQEELGRRVGRAGSVISNYENNIKIPTLDVLTTMARIYDVSLDYLVGFDKKDQVLLTDMTDEQRDLVRRLVKELKQSTKPRRGIIYGSAGNSQLDYAGVCKIEKNRICYAVKSRVN